MVYFYQMCDVFFGLYTPPPPRPKTPFTHVVYVYSDISLSKGYLGSRGKASKTNWKTPIFIFPMTYVTVLSVFRTHVQKEYHKVFEVKSTSSLNILAFLLLVN